MNIEAKFSQELLPNERFLWTGQPDPYIFFTASDWFAVPFSIFWAGMAAYSLFPHFPEIDISSFFNFGALLFIAVGFYMLFGRFIFKYLKKKKTYYAITNYRALILTELFERNLQAINVKTIGSITKQTNGMGTGSILFGEPGQKTTQSSMGMALLHGNTLGFFDIHNIDEVYEKMNR